MDISSFSSLPKNKQQAKAKQIYIGVNTSQIPKEQLLNYFQKKNLKLRFPKKNMKKFKKYLVAKTSDPYTFKFLTSIEQSHSVGDLSFTTEEYLTGKNKLAKDIKEAKKKIYIGNIPKEAANEDLKHIFSRFGKIKTAYVSQKKSMDKSNKSNKYGFVVFEHQISAELAIKFNSVSLEGNVLSVRPFRSKWSKANMEENSGEDVLLSNGLDVRKINKSDGILRRRWGASFKHFNRLFEKRVKVDGRILKFDRVSKSYFDSRLIEFLKLKHSVEKWNLVLNEGSKKFYF